MHDLLDVVEIFSVLLDAPPSFAVPDAAEAITVGPGPRLSSYAHIQVGREALGAGECQGSCRVFGHAAIA